MSVRLREYAPVTLVVVVGIILWELSVLYFAIPKYLLPAPSKVLTAVRDSLATLLGVHTPVTLMEAGLGLLMATAAGILGGGLIHLSGLVRRVCYPLVVVSQTIPVIVLAPLLVIWFGYGILPKLLVVTLACFFPMVVAIVDGLDGADKEKLKLLRSMGATRRQEFLLVKLPAAMPSFFTGLRVSATYAVMAGVIAEWMGADAGLGVYIVRSAHSFRTEQVFAGILLISVFSILSFLVVGYVRRIALPWERFVGEQKRGGA